MSFEYWVMLTLLGVALIWLAHPTHAFRYALVTVIITIVALSSLALGLILIPIFALLFFIVCWVTFFIGVFRSADELFVARRNDA